MCAYQHNENNTKCLCKTILDQKIWISSNIEGNDKITVSPWPVFSTDRSENLP